MGEFILVSLLVLTLGKSIPVYGFDDFTYDGVFYDNPSREVALRFGGQVVEVNWDVVERLSLKGPGLGIGLDPGAEEAYINGSAFELYSLAVEGPDAGDYECGHLYARLLEEHPCSLFVHIPVEPSAQDIVIIKKAISKIQQCIRR